MQRFGRRGVRLSRVVAGSGLNRATSEEYSAERNPYKIRVFVRSIGDIEIVSAR